MISVVLDTNVIVSAFLNNEGAEATAVDLVLAGEMEQFASEAILRAYEATLSRPKFARAINAEQIEGLMASLRSVARMVEPTEMLSVSSHEPDNRFLECAEAAQADFLVRGNKRHFPAKWKGTHIVNARELFSLIDLKTDEL